MGSMGFPMDFMGLMEISDGKYGDCLCGDVLRIFFRWGFAMENMGIAYGDLLGRSLREICDDFFVDFFGMVMGNSWGRSCF